MLKKGENPGHGVVMNIRKPNPLQVNKQQSGNPLRASGTESFNSKTKLRSFAGISQNPLLSKLTQKPDKKTIEFRDWKNSFYYKHLLVRHESDEDKVLSKVSGAVAHDAYPHFGCWGYSLSPPRLPPRWSPRPLARARVRLHLVQQKVLAK